MQTINKFEFYYVSIGGQRCIGIIEYTNLRDLASKWVDVINCWAEQGIINELDQQLIAKDYATVRFYHEGTKRIIRGNVKV